MTGSPVLRRADALRDAGAPFVLATVVRAERPTSARPGDRALVLADGTVEGFVGGSCAEATVRLEGLRLLRDGASTLLRITPAAESTASSTAPAEGLIVVDNPCLSGGTLEIFLEAMVPPTVVHVYGDAPVARALARVGAALDYDVRTGDGPPSPDCAAVVVASHGRDEETVLIQALQAGVPYVALVASRRRGAAVVGGLAVDEQARTRVRYPAGLDLGTMNPSEIALSIYAEMLAARERVVAPAPPAGASDVASLSACSPESLGARISASSTDDGSATDPVCGMAVARVPAAPTAVVDGTTSWFCGPGCRQAFVDDPARHRDPERMP